MRGAGGPWTGRPFGLPSARRSSAALTGVRCLLFGVSPHVRLRFCVPRQLCLTEGAKDECNVVEVVARDHDNQEIAVPVANLRLSCQPMVSCSPRSLECGGRPASEREHRPPDGWVRVHLPPILSSS